MTVSSTTPPVIVHYHIFKNAGTSVDWALENCFGKLWDTFEGQHAHDVMQSEKLLEFLEQNPKVRAVSSHLLRPSVKIDNVLPIVFLRHPVIRAKSVYLFSRIDVNQPDNKITANMTFPEYIKWVVSGGRGGVVVINYQTIHLSQASFRSSSILDAIATSEDLRCARSLLLGWPAFGIVEYFEKSMALFENAYSKFVPEFRLLTTHANATQKSPLTVDDQLIQIQDEIGNGLYEEFCAINEFDLSLYETCKNHFMEIA